MDHDRRPALDLILDFQPIDATRAGEANATVVGVEGKRRYGSDVLGRVRVYDREDHVGVRRLVFAADMSACQPRCGVQCTSNLAPGESLTRPVVSNQFHPHLTLTSFSAVHQQYSVAPTPHIWTLEQYSCLAFGLRRAGASQEHCPSLFCPDNSMLQRSAGRTRRYNSHFRFRLPHHVCPFSPLRDFPMMCRTRPPRGRQEQYRLAPCDPVKLDHGALLAPYISIHLDL